MAVLKSNQVFKAGVDGIFVFLVQVMGNSIVLSKEHLAMTGFASLIQGIVRPSVLLSRLGCYFKEVFE